VEDVLRLGVYRTVEPDGHRDASKARPPKDLIVGLVLPLSRRLLAVGEHNRDIDGVIERSRTPLHEVSGAPVVRQPRQPLVVQLRLGADGLTQGNHVSDKGIMPHVHD
jgi:hypothetical protein